MDRLGLLTHPQSFPDVIKTVVSLGGDTDTIAAMAGAHLGFHAIPPAWQPVEGHDRLFDLADRLYAHEINL